MYYGIIYYVLVTNYLFIGFQISRFPKFIPEFISHKKGKNYLLYFINCVLTLFLFFYFFIFYC